ncbi:MAG: FRG domain-containing protein [Prolixibacteraceae bacterium]|jgi:hypothetical protein
MSNKEDKHIFIETTLDNWSDIFKLNERFLSKFIYRGQADEKWGLSTSLERQMNKLYPYLIDKSVISDQEREMIRDFQWKYPLYSNKTPDSNDFVEWLTIMQHYGSATRLLDFSFSVFVAMYMAVFNNGDSGAVWAINKIPINFQVFDEYRKRNNVNGIGQNILDAFSLELANDAIGKSFEIKIEKQLFIIKPKLSNERLSRQQGLFLMPSDIKCTFFECMKTYLNKTDPISVNFTDLINYSHGAKYKQEDISIIKIVIPKENNYLITKYLRAMNLTAEVLFPGLEGLAKSMNFGRSSIGQKDE